MFSTSTFCLEIFQLTISSQDLIQLLLLLTADTEGVWLLWLWLNWGIACKIARWTPILWGYGLVEYPGSHKSPVGPTRLRSQEHHCWIFLIASKKTTLSTATHLLDRSMACHIFHHHPTNLTSSFPVFNHLKPSISAHPFISKQRSSLIFSLGSRRMCSCEEG